MATSSWRRYERMQEDLPGGQIPCEMPASAVKCASRRLRERQREGRLFWESQFKVDPGGDAV